MKIAGKLIGFDFCFSIRWNSKDLWREFVPRCALQNTVAVDTRLCPGRCQRDAIKIRFGQSRSTALLPGASQQRRHRIHSRRRRMPTFHSHESSHVQRYV